ncbi:lactococcin 972 family bacteriocin [Kytococcus sp. Marseille-QA3725]
MRMRRSMAGAALTAVVTTTCATAAFAAVETTNPTAGGTWRHGTTGSFGGGTVVSEYLHDSRDHSSSVRNCDGEENRSGVKSKGTWANSSIGACQLATDHAYYDVV